MCLKYIVFMFLFLDPNILLAQDSPLFVEEGGLWTLLSSWGGFAKVISFMISAQLFLRCVAEALTRFSDWTDTKLDNKVAAWFSQVVWLIGIFLGKFGYGQPTLSAKHRVAVFTPKT